MDQPMTDSARRCENGTHEAKAGEPSCPCGATLFRWRADGAMDVSMNPLVAEVARLAAELREELDTWSDSDLYYVEMGKFQEIADRLDILVGSRKAL